MSTLPPGGAPEEETTPVSRRPRRGRSRATFAEQTAGSAPPPDSDAWRRVHKITPILNIWQVLAVLVTVGVVNVLEAASDIEGLWDLLVEFWVPVLLGVLGVFLVVGIVAAVYSAASWKRMRYAVDENAVHFHQGILTKEQRVARLNRIQAVDVVQPLLARLFGLARIVIETAGGGDSQVKIQYLELGEAERVRREILHLAADRPPAGAPAGGVPGDGAPTAPGASPHPPASVPSTPGGPALRDREREVYRVAPGRLVASVLLDTGVIAAVVALVASIVFLVLTPISLGVLLGSVPVVLALGGFVIGRVAGEWGLTAKVAPEGIRLRRGLLQTTTQTLPPGRIQAVRLRQGLIWKFFGWWRVQVNVAGYGAGDRDGESTSSQTVLLPVGDREQALTALWLVVDDLGVEDPRPLLDAALGGHGTAGGFLVSPDRARTLDPLTYRHNGLALTDTVMIVRHGRFTRTVVVVPNARLQSVALTQGPLERRYRLGNVVSHSVPGPIDEIAAYHLDVDQAAAILEAQARRARAARAVQDPDAWARRVGVPDRGATVPATGPAAVPASVPDAPDATGQVRP